MTTGGRLCAQSGWNRGWDGRVARTTDPGQRDRLCAQTAVTP